MGYYILILLLFFNADIRFRSAHGVLVAVAAPSGGHQPLGITVYYCYHAAGGRHWGRPLQPIPLSNTVSNQYHVLPCTLYDMIPIQRKISLRLAMIISRTRSVMPTYSARIKNFSEGLRRVMSS